MQAERRVPSTMSPTRGELAVRLFTLSPFWLSDKIAYNNNPCQSLHESVLCGTVFPPVSGVEAVNEMVATV